MNKKPYFICMDSGGTSTYTCSIDIDGKVLVDYYNGIGSPAVKYDEAFKNIYEGVSYIYQNTPSEYYLAYISLGVSGLGAVDDVEAFEQSFIDVYKVPCKIVTDCEASLHAILKNQLNSGILVVAGTGNATFGINQDKSLLVGGGGPLLNEQGSCYSCIHDYALVIKNKYERNIKFNKFDNWFLSMLGVKDYPTLKTFFYQHTKAQIASFAVNIMELARLGNVGALKIIEKQAFYLATQVTIMSKSLNIENGAILGLVGGLWKNNPFLLEKFEFYLNKKNLSFQIVYVDEKSVMGSYYIALKNWR